MQSLIKDTQYVLCMRRHSGGKKKQEATGSYFIHTTGSGPVLFWLSLLMNEWMRVFCDAIATTEVRQPLHIRQHVVRTGGPPGFRHSCHAYPLSTSALCGLHWKNNKDETPVFLLCLPNVVSDVACSHYEEIKRQRLKYTVRSKQQNENSHIHTTDPQDAGVENICDCTGKKTIRCNTHCKKHLLASPSCFILENLNSKCKFSLGFGAACVTLPNATWGRHSVHACHSSVPNLRWHLLFVFLVVFFCISCETPRLWFHRCL